MGDNGNDAYRSKIGVNQFNYYSFTTLNSYSVVDASTLYFVDTLVTPTLQQISTFTVTSSSYSSSTSTLTQTSALTTDISYNWGSITSTNLAQNTTN